MSKVSPMPPYIRTRTRARTGSAVPASDGKALHPDPVEEDAQCESLARSQPAPAGPYAVGYKRPPKATQFQKGHSGNPRGRPKGAKNVGTLAHEVMNTRRSVRIDGRDRMMSGAEIMLHQQAKKAMTGDHKATQLFLGLLRESETKAALAAASTAPAACDEGISETEAAILAHHYRAELTESGLDERTVELALITFGLLPKETDR